MTKGWFVGNFLPSVLKTDACEVAIKKYSQGDREERHFHRIATEITLIVSGKVVMNSKEFVAGDIVLLSPGEDTDFLAIEDTVTAVVKIPSHTDDKFFGSIADFNF